MHIVRVTRKQIEAANIGSVIRRHRTMKTLTNHVYISRCAHGLCTCLLCACANGAGKTRPPDAHAGYAISGSFRLGTTGVAQSEVLMQARTQCRTCSRCWRRCSLLITARWRTQHALIVIRRECPQELTCPGVAGIRRLLEGQQGPRSRHRRLELFAGYSFHQRHFGDVQLGGRSQEFLVFALMTLEFGLVLLTL